MPKGDPKPLPGDRWRRGVKAVINPTYTCAVCRRVVTVDFYARGFPPDAAKRKLIRLCKADGHTADPRYLAGIS